MPETPSETLEVSRQEMDGLFVLLRNIVAVLEKAGMEDTANEVRAQADRMMVQERITWRDA